MLAQKSQTSLNFMKHTISTVSYISSSKGVKGVIMLLTYLVIRHEPTYDSRPQKKYGKEERTSDVDCNVQDRYLLQGRPKLTFR